MVWWDFELPNFITVYKTSIEKLNVFQFVPTETSYTVVGTVESSTELVYRPTVQLRPKPDPRVDPGEVHKDRRNVTLPSQGSRS